MNLNLKFKESPSTFKLDFNSNSNKFDTKFREDSPTFYIDFGEFAPITFIYNEWYEGPYTIDPLSEPVTINIKNLTAKRDIVVKPYPKAYAYVEQKLLTIVGNFPIEVM